MLIQVKNAFLNSEYIISIKPVIRLDPDKNRPYSGELRRVPMVRVTTVEVSGNHGIVPVNTSYDYDEARAVLDWANAEAHKVVPARLVRIGNVFLNPKYIISVKSILRFVPDKDRPYSGEGSQVPTVRVTTIEVSGNHGIVPVHTFYDYDVGTFEATAALNWANKEAHKVGQVLVVQYSGASFAL